MSTTFTIADDYDPDGDMSPDADPAKRTLIYGFDIRRSHPLRTSTGDLSTVPEFGGISIGPLDKYLSRTEVPSSIRQLDQFLHQKSDS
jgi:hypothetical protein